MTSEKQRIAIAEACGWKLEGSLWRQPDKTKAWAGGVIVLPDYLNDLNAMHEAEKTLTWDQRRVFEGQLGRIVRRDCDDAVRPILWLHSHATAAQRAEAFLRTIGKWDDSL